MAAPPQDLGAHDRAARAGGAAEQGGERGLERGRLGVVCVVLERRVLPAGVAGWFDQLALAAAAAEIGHRDVRDPVARQLAREHAGIELRIGARAGEVADVDERLDVPGGERSDELGVRAIRVTNRVEAVHGYGSAAHAGFIDPMITDAPRGERVRKKRGGTCTIDVQTQVRYEAW